MANPFGEKNIGPWEGQQVEYIPLDDLVLWTENPRDPLDGDYTNDDVIRRATDGRNEKQWQLSKLSKEMGDRFDLSELPTVCRIDDGPKYRVYDGNRRVILAMLRKAGLTTEGQQQLVPPDFPDPIPCNVCDEETALENVERKHRGNGSWKQYERDRFMFDYRGGPKTVLIRLEELIKAVTKWPALNMRYVEDDVFNKKHLEEMGLLPDEPDFGVPLELAGKDTIRRHADSMFSYCGFGRTQCADMREIDAEVEAAPIPKAPEHANIDLSGLLTEEDIRLYQAASEATPHGKIRPVNPHACRKVYAVLDLLRERFTVEWDPESKGYRKAIRRPR